MRRETRRSSGPTGHHATDARAAGGTRRTIAAVRAAIEHAVACFNGTPGQPGTFDRLHDLLDRQPYRVAHWKTAFDEINYRRFFDINDLGAIRMEDPRVFDAAHRKILQLIADGKVTGLRIDHPDGLLDPAAYFHRLERAAADAAARGGLDRRSPAASTSPRKRFWPAASFCPTTGRSPARPATDFSMR